MSEHTDVVSGELVHGAEKFDPLVDDFPVVASDSELEPNCP